MHLKQQVTYFLKGGFSFYGKNVIYLIICDKCKEECSGFAIYFKPCVRVRKSDIKQKMTVVIHLDVLTKSVYVPLLPLDMSKFKSLNKSTRKTHRKLKKGFGIDKVTNSTVDSYQWDE